MKTIFTAVQAMTIIGKLARPISGGLCPSHLLNRNRCQAEDILINSFPLTVRSEEAVSILFLFLMYMNGFYDGEGGGGGGKLPSWQLDTLQSGEEL